MSHRARLYDDLTPREYLRFIAGLDGRVDRLAVDDALEHTGLTSVAGEPVRSFSQGMRQRLAIARANMRRPRLLLLDQPYSALDATAREAANTLVIEVKNDGGTVIIATHDTVRAAPVADRGVELVGGQIANHGARALVPRLLGHLGVSLLSFEVANSYLSPNLSLEDDARAGGPSGDRAALDRSSTRTRQSRRASRRWERGQDSGVGAQGVLQRRVDRRRLHRETSEPRAGAGFPAVVSGFQRSPGPRCRSPIRSSSVSPAGPE